MMTATPGHFARTKGNGVGTALRRRVVGGGRPASDMPGAVQVHS